MYLKSLEIIGFKSFADMTRLEFNSNITAVVGPNGCGKSNIADAIRWVLGEQSSKLLRGSKMEDLIFNGSKGRKPLGRAEVSLTITDITCGVTISGISSPTDEVLITRTLFRSGESEYSINRTPCRLKDIVDLFLDTGISTRSFSIIEQGQVSNILNSKPEDRRVLIEEAAGIMKYKHRKNEAIRKLESSQQNLLRLGDILNELERQMATLKRQAKKAEIYKKHRDEIRELSLSLIASEYRRLAGDLGSTESDLNLLREQNSERLANGSSLENRIEVLRSEVIGLEKRLSQLKQEVFEEERRIEREEDRIGLLQTQIREGEDEDTRSADEMKSLENEFLHIGSYIKDRQEEEERGNNDISSQEKVYNERYKDIAGFKEDLSKRESQLKEMESGLINLISRMSQMKNIMTSLETRLDILSKREEKVGGEEYELRERLNGLKEKLNRSREGLIDIKEAMEKTKQERISITGLLNDCRNRLKRENEDIRALKEKLAVQSALQKSLEEFQNNLEGFQEGVRSLMKIREQGELPGIHGILVDYIKTSPEYEVAIEAVLGDKLQGIIVESHADSIMAIGYLRNKSGGRSTFLPITPRDIKGNAHSMNGKDGVIGNALVLVSCDGRYEKVFEYLLGDVVVVRDFDTALSLWNSNGIHSTIVTLDGDIIDPYGIVVGGGTVNGGSSLLKKKREIKELNREIEDLKGRLYELEKTRSMTHDNLLSFEKEEEELKKRVYDEDLRCIGEEKDIQQVEKECRRAEERLEIFNYEKSEFDAERGGIDSDLERVRKELGDITITKEEKNSDVEKLRETIRILRIDIGTRGEEVNKMEVLLTSLRGKRENILLDIERLNKERGNIESRIKRIEKGRSELKEKRERFKYSIKEAEDAISNISRKRDERKREIIRIEEDLRERLEVLKGLEDEFRVLKKEIEGLNERTKEVELRKAELGVRIDHLVKRTSVDYGIEIEELLRIETNEIDEEEVNKRLQGIKEAVANIGEVNLSAIGEYQNISERYTFLKEQQDDLISSIKSLHRAIEKINSTTKTRFMDTFNLVNEKFKAIFRRLFNGGRGELVLCDEGNPLETGVDIIVQPPGKKTQNITLLSAGEKAMSTIGLLFSIFAIKPTPFCLLDEVDAPLDEANILRFRNILMEMTDKTKFIIITHNQKSMSFADTLYGITMEEDGVSKIVSVKLN
ncbi:MAG: chromosome segregation protein SMC [Nitrospinae bacterium]|nr:chromosome segregation protein SMC [Nitrospinota bacterium]